MSIKKFIVGSISTLEIAKICERACNYENMLAHGISCRVRIDKYSQSKNIYAGTGFV